MSDNASVTRGSGNVFADLDLPNPEAEMIKAQADTIERLQAENARLRSFLSEGQYQGYESELAWKRRALAAEAELARLKGGEEGGETPKPDWKDGLPQTLIVE